jgi:hypothetical protein
VDAASLTTGAKIGPETGPKPSILKSWQGLARLDLAAERSNYATVGPIGALTMAQAYVLYQALPAGAIAASVTWIGIFWISYLSILFIFNSHSLIQYFGHNHLYYRSIASPIAFITYLMLKQALLAVVSGLLLTLFLTLFSGDLMNYSLQMALCLGIAGITLSSALLLTGIISAQTSSPGIMNILLGVPVSLPLLAGAVRATKMTFDNLDSTILGQNVILLLAMAVIAQCLTVLLFPSIWKN